MIHENPHCNHSLVFGSADLSEFNNYLGRINHESLDGTEFPYLSRLRQKHNFSVKYKIGYKGKPNIVFFFAYQNRLENVREGEFILNISCCLDSGEFIS